jgi:hypothetical protein
MHFFFCFIFILRISGRIIFSFSYRVIATLFHLFLHGTFGLGICTRDSPLFGGRQFGRPLNEHCMGEEFRAFQTIALVYEGYIVLRESMTLGRLAGTAFPVGHWQEGYPAGV